METQGRIIETGPGPQDFVCVDFPTEPKLSKRVLSRKDKVNIAKREANAKKPKQNHQYNVQQIKFSVTDKRGVHHVTSETKILP